MHIAERLLNKAEEVAFRELDAIVQDNALRLFAKPRLSDVILKDRPLSQADFGFYTKAHVDFVVTDERTKPLFIVEYDGPTHATPVQQRRDKTKDGLCADAGLGILRINANHVTKRNRGMSVLWWIIEVTELEKAFHDAQQSGHVPWDEPFDAAMIMDDGKGRKWPYWLSVSATQALKSFTLLDTSEGSGGWANVMGSDAENNLLELSYCWTGDTIIWSKTGVRRQNFEFPAYDLLREISTCELELKVREHRAGRLQATSPARMQQILQEFCARYDARPSHSHSRGTAPSTTPGVSPPAGRSASGPRRRAFPLGAAEQLDPVWQAGTDDRNCPSRW